MGNKANRRRNVRRINTFAGMGRIGRAKPQDESHAADRTVYHVSVKCNSQAEADELIRKLRASRFTNHSIPHECRSVGATGQTSPCKRDQPSTSKDTCIDVEDNDDDDEDIECMDDDNESGEEQSSLADNDNDVRNPSIDCDDNEEDDENDGIEEKDVEDDELGAYEEQGGNDQEADEDEEADGDKDQGEEDQNEDGWGEDDEDQEDHYLGAPDEDEHRTNEGEAAQPHQQLEDEEVADNMPMPMLAAFGENQEEEDFTDAFNLNN